MDRNSGFIEVICGPMFSGKTSELLRRLDRFEFANKKYLLIKPKLDTRFSEEEVVARGKKGKKSYSVNSAEDILALVKEHVDARIIAIDEAQFFNTTDKINLFTVCKKLKKENYHIIINGLDMDHNGEPFGLMPQLLAIANDVQKLTAVCKYPGCGKDAEMSYKFTKKSGETVELGDGDKYEARCHLHWLLPSSEE